MKKLFIVLAVASLGFVACNNESEGPETTTDTTPAVEAAPVAPDTTVAAPDTTAAADTSKM